MGTGKYIQLSSQRKLIIDLLHFASRVPTLPMERQFDVSAVLESRENLNDRPSWTSLFLKGFGVLSKEFPELRTTYVPYPLPRLYELEHSVASIAMEKVVDSEKSVLFAKISQPESLSLSEINDRIQQAKKCQPNKNAQFRLAIGVTKLPLFIRRFVWWFALEWSGRLKLRKFGTFGLSTVGSLGAEGTHPLSPLTATLSFGPISDEGKVRVRIIYDHRVCDGAQVARALARLEEILLTEVQDELIQQKKIEEQNQSTLENITSQE